MREGRSSVTALLVAIGRGLGTRAADADPATPAVMPRPIGAVLGAVQKLGRIADPARWIARMASAGMVDHVCLRTAAIDSALVEAIDRGCKQLVVLGAGLDVRAWRLPILADVEVFEVDHPATQAEKRRRMRVHDPLARGVHFVAVDFTAQSVAERLVPFGHDPEVPTFWIWEGVTPYLTSEAIEATLADIAVRSAVGSEIAMTYAVPELPLPHALHQPIYSAFAVLGEPLHGLMTSRRAAEQLQAVGFAIVDDTGSSDWATRFAGHARLARPFSAERLVVARRLPPQARALQ